MERNYFEKVCWNEITSKETAKQLSFLKYQKVAKKGHEHDQALSKTHQKKHFDVAPIFDPSELYHKSNLWRQICAHWN